MSFTAILINLFVLMCLLFSFVKNREKTKKALKVALKAFLQMLPTVLIIITIIGLLFGLLSERVLQLIAEQSGKGGFLLIALLGAVMHIPALLAFPLAASFLENGLSISGVAVFITTLTMIGIVTLPLEIQIMGKKFTLLRNSLSFISAILIAIIMGVVL